MSTTLFFLIPIGMLAVVWSVCFVGCVFHTSGLASPYSDNIVNQTGLIAYWPLSDLLTPLTMPGQTSVAQDISGGGHNGTYTIPPAYPAVLANSMVFPNPSLARAASIVAGDAGSTKNPLPASVDFEGGYVSIPWAANSPSLAEFTLEAWVQPKWTSTGFNWLVFAGRTNNNTGFDIYINAQNQWQFNIGDGTTINPVITSVPAAVGGALTYVAVTFKSTSGTTGILSLWINPTSDSDSNNPPPPTPAWPTDPGMTTTYAALNQTQPVTFFIGAGDNTDVLRTQAGGTGAPKFPFQGLIQSVALYDVALDATTLADHFSNGSAG